MASLVPIISNEVGDKPVACCLDANDEALSEEVNEVIVNASSRWLKNDEVLAVLESFQIEDLAWPKEAAEKPEGGKLFIFSRKACRAFRSDKHNWRKKQDGRTVKETHEKLKVGDRERLNCYYAHAEGSEGLQRRCYWILDTAKDDVVLVHYLCTTTSRAGARGGGPSSSAVVAATAAPSQRPQRLAAQRARYGMPRFGSLLASDDEKSLGSLGRDDSEGATVPVQLAGRPSESGAGGSAPMQSPQTGAGGGGNNNGLLRDGSLIGYSFLDKMPVNPEWHDLPSLQEMYASSLHKRGTEAAPGPGLLQVSQAQARAAANGKGNPGSPTKSPQRRLAHDPLGSVSILHADMSALLMDPLPFADSRPYGPLSHSSPSRRHGGEGRNPDDDSGVLRGMPLGSESLSGMLLPSMSSMQRSFEMADGDGNGNPESPGARLIHSTGITFAGRVASGSLPLAQDQGRQQQQQPSAAANNGVGAGVGAGGWQGATQPPQTAAALFDPKTSVEQSHPVEQQKVQTIRRIMAPSYRARDHSPSLADVARRASGGSGVPSPSTGGDDPLQPRRKNPIAAPSPLSHTDRVAVAVAHAAADSNAQREERLKELRLARQAEEAATAAAGGGGGNGGNNSDDVELIQSSTNHFFRITSHLVGGQGAAAAAAAAAAVSEIDAEGGTADLLKQMSIDLKKGPTTETGADAGGEGTATLLRNMSIDERGAPADTSNSGDEDCEGEGDGDPNFAPTAAAAAAGGGAESDPYDPIMAFGSEQEYATRSHTATTADVSEDPASRDPSLSSLLDITLSMGFAQQGNGGSGGAAAVGAGVGGAAGVVPGSPPASGSAVDEKLQAAFALHAARKSAKAGR